MKLRIPKKVLFSIGLICITIIILSRTTIGRYIYDSLNNHLLESQAFYFQSSILTMDGNTYSVSNWDGVNPYILTIDVNNKKNELISTNVDINYDISVSCPDSVSCSLSKNRGIISKTLKTDSYTITITPIDNFYEGDSVEISTSATSTYPYTKRLEASYIIGVENYGFSYKIIDEVGSKYLTLELTNSKPYYEVVEVFDDYSIGDHVSLDIYNSLSANNKLKCVSNRVTINFNPNILLLDLNDDVYINCNSYNTTNINGYSFVNSLTFDILANYNEKISFYKRNINTSYNLNNSNITVSIGN